MSEQDSYVDESLYDRDGNYVIIDDEYPDCFYEQIKSFSVTVDVLTEMKMNNIGNIRYLGFCLSGLIILLSIFDKYNLLNEANDKVKEVEGKIQG